MRRTQVAHTSCLVLLLHAVILVSTLLSVATTAWAQEGRKVGVETIQFKSELIGKVLPYDALLPVGYAESNKRYPVLYLLHGLFGRYDDWVTRTNLPNTQRTMILLSSRLKGTIAGTRTAPERQQT